MKRIASLLFLSALCALAVAQPTARTDRVRGTIEAASAQSLVVRDRSGTLVSMALADDIGVTEVQPVDPEAIQSGAFVGTTAVPGPDGRLAAVEVHVFPEAARGTGEGHRTLDPQTGSTMTNATVASVQRGTGERTITLRYKDGEKVIRVPEGVPVVTMSAGDRTLLAPGAKVTVTTQSRNGQLTATRAIVGRDGFVPPL